MVHNFPGYETNIVDTALPERFAVIFDAHWWLQAPWRKAVERVVACVNWPLYFGGDTLEPYAGLTTRDIPRWFKDRMAVVGNHDNGLLPHLPRVLRDKRQGIAIWHGHNQDDYSREGLPDRVVDFLGRLAHKLDMKGRPGLGNVARIFRDRRWPGRVLGEANVMGIDVGFVGHSHRPKVLRHEAFINPKIKVIVGGSHGTGLVYWDRGEAGYINEDCTRRPV